MRDGVAKSFCVGGTGSMIGAATAHPFDLIKVRLQVQGEAKARQKGMKRGAGSGHFAYPSRFSGSG